MDDFPTTKNGKVDKRALVAMAEDESGVGQKRLSVRNSGVPFSSKLPGTPNSINEQPSFEWSKVGTNSAFPGSAPSNEHLSDNQRLPTDRRQSSRDDGPGSAYVLNGLPRIVCVDAV